MICKNCAREYNKKYRTEFCSVKCSNLYTGKQKNPIYLLVKDYKEFNDIPKEVIKKLYAIDTYNVSCTFKTYGLDGILTEYRKFKNENKLCPNCGDFYSAKHSRRNNICPKESCKEYYENKKKNASLKTAKTKLKNHGDPKYNNREKFKDTCKAKSPEEIELWNKHRSEAHQKTEEEWKLIVLKRQETYKKRAGYSNPGQNPEVRKKARQTNLKKYGAENPLQNKKIKEKLKETNLKKYGAEYVTQTQNMKVKTKQTNLKNYGVEYISQSPLIQEKIKQTNLKNYGVEYISQSPLIQEKIKQTNLEKRGVKYFSQEHIKNYSDYESPDVWKNFKTIQEARDYFNVGYNAVLKHFHKYNPEIVKNRSVVQNLIFNAIPVDNKLANAKTIIPPKELDIYLPDYKLAIEYDGLLFHSQGISNHTMLNTPNFDKNYHLQKTLECKFRGIQLLHIFEGENIDLWLSMINSKLGLNERIYARNCYAVELRNSDIKSFLDENHLQGFCNASIVIGLYLRNTKNSTKVQDIEASKLAAIMTFSKPRFSKGYDYELVRFCSLKGYNVIGGASKLWKFFLKKYNPKSVISYANLRFSNGGLYKKLGFSLKHRSEPNYYYFKPNEGVLHSRNKFQKHKLPSIMENFNPDKSEVENMFANGYRRIFDCGNLVYEWLQNS